MIVLAVTRGRKLVTFAVHDRRYIAIVGVDKLTAGAPSHEGAKAEAFADRSSPLMGEGPETCHAERRREDDGGAHEHRWDAFGAEAGAGAGAGAGVGAGTGVGFADLFIATPRRGGGRSGRARGYPRGPAFVLCVRGARPLRRRLSASLASTARRGGRADSRPRSAPRGGRRATDVSIAVMIRFMS